MSVLEIGCSKPGELATVVEVDSDGDFRPWYSGGLAVVLLRDLFGMLHHLLHNRVCLQPSQRGCMARPMSDVGSMMLVHGLGDISFGEITSSFFRSVHTRDVPAPAQPGVTPSPGLVCTDGRQVPLSVWLRC